MRIYTIRDNRRRIVIAMSMMLFLSIPGYVSASFYQSEKNNPYSTGEYVPFEGFSPTETVLQETPVLRGFGDGGGGFDDSGAGEDEGGFNDAAPVGDTWFIMVALTLIYGIGRYGISRRSQINRRRGE